MADQENRGGDGDSVDGEEDSVMGVNLAEGGGTVNATPWRVEREARDRRERRDLKVRSSGFEVLGSEFQNLELRTSNPASLARRVRELCSLAAFLYKNDCAGH